MVIDNYRPFIYQASKAKQDAFVCSHLMGLSNKAQEQAESWVPIQQALVCSPLFIYINNSDDTFVLAG